MACWVGASGQGNMAKKANTYSGVREGILLGGRKKFALKINSMPRN